jgi:hypothetical protein
MRGKKPLEPMQIYIVQDNHCSVACTTDQTLAYVVLDIHARPTKWPEGFGDHHEKLLGALFDGERLGRS